MLRIHAIEVRYRLRVPPGKTEAARRALERHVEGCPVARTLTPCVRIEWDAEIQEKEESQ